MALFRRLFDLPFLTAKAGGGGASASCGSKGQIWRLSGDTHMHTHTHVHTHNLTLTYMHWHTQAYSYRVMFFHESLS